VIVAFHCERNLEVIGFLVRPRLHNANNSQRRRRRPTPREAARFLLTMKHGDVNDDSTITTANRVGIISPEPSFPKTSSRSSPFVFLNHIDYSDEDPCYSVSSVLKSSVIGRSKERSKNDNAAESNGEEDNEKGEHCSSNGSIRRASMSSNSSCDEASTASSKLTPETTQSQFTTPANSAVAIKNNDVVFSKEASPPSLSSLSSSFESSESESSTSTPPSTPQLSEEEEEEAVVDIVSTDDKKLISGALFVAMEQMRICKMTEDDKVGRYKSAKSRSVGFVGFCCKHCGGKPGFGRFYPDSLRSLSQTTTSHTILKHVSQKCTKVPDHIKRRVNELIEVEEQQKQQQRHKEEDAAEDLAEDLEGPMRGKKRKRHRPPQHPKYGSRKVFFERVWSRLHEHQDDDVHGHDTGSDHSGSDRQPNSSGCGSGSSSDSDHASSHDEVDDDGSILIDDDIVLHPRSKSSSSSSSSSMLLPSRIKRRRKSGLAATPLTLIRRSSSGSGHRSIKTPARLYAHHSATTGNLQ